MDRATAPRSIPKPLPALPCESRSMTSTRSPSRAREVPRFTTVVVLPTPPFWLVQASVRLTRGGANGVHGVSLLPSRAGRGTRGGHEKHRARHVAGTYPKCCSTRNVTVKHSHGGTFTRPRVPRET